MKTKQEIEVRDFNDPKQARKYIKEFDWGAMPSRPNRIRISDGRIINLNKMSDEEACEAASLIYMDIQCKVEEMAAKRNGEMQ